MNRPSNRPGAVPFSGASRIHLGLEVEDVARSLAFFRVLLGVEPSKVRPGYAKLEPSDPPVNLSLSQGRGGPLARPGSATHFGLQVQSTGAVEAAQARLAAAGFAVRVERGVECCYAVQDKVWVDDPDGNAWEVFVVTAADAPRRAPEQGACCAPAPAGEPCCGGS